MSRPPSPGLSSLNCKARLLSALPTPLPPQPRRRSHTITRARQALLAAPLPTGPARRQRVPQFRGPAGSAPPRSARRPRSACTRALRKQGPRDAREGCSSVLLPVPRPESGGDRERSSRAGRPAAAGPLRPRLSPPAPGAAAPPPAAGGLCWGRRAAGGAGKATHRAAPRAWPPCRQTPGPPRARCQQPGPAGGAARGGGARGGARVLARRGRVSRFQGPRAPGRLYSGRVHQTLLVAYLSFLGGVVP